ncbi:hypothetical protein [Streptacidiphilus fuscans]|uniref:Uncharacterized protein n=1 Tax=Streptacidiphilus fuscans TaxID=2789292 RepID=A0A931FIJ8_9ACTN|nr:hypothetical protein [Streptacidiphilus fuscans]MBF9072185.1 hypothetical protein [Streptacidiphilus fuscans]MBF9072996.1 hypothetical protein [Streptacidiphilus fuscans]
MGIESEQLVYDYLSRVGDLAQSAALTAADRARLVNSLRQTIDAQKAASSSGSTRAEVNSVRKILSGLGAPDEVVRRAAGGSLPEPSESGGRRWGASRSGASTGPSEPSGPSVPVGQVGPSGPSVPAQAAAPASERVARPARGADVGADAFGDADADSVYAADEWWRGAKGRRGGARPIDSPPGWAGGLLEEFFRDQHADVMDPVTGLPKPQPVADEDAADGEGEGEAGEAEAGPDAASGRRTWLRRVLAGGQASGGAGGAVADVPAVPRVPRVPLPFVESLATLVLVAALVTGLWYLALLGWLFAYAGHRFGHRVSRIASLWIPGICAAACGFWLYSRTGHAPGHPGLTSAQLTAASHAAFATWLRGGAALSAAFLGWRIYRR